MTHFLHEVAAMWRLDEQMDLPVLWIKRRIAAGKFRARRIGRQWVMTDDDIAYNLDQLANVQAVSATPAKPVEHVIGTPSNSSMRRRLAVAK